MARLQQNILENKGAKIKVFISYSRKDKNFAEKLAPALEAAGLDVFIDTSEHRSKDQQDAHGIAKFEDWWKRLEYMIAKSDTVIYVISPDSMASPVCEDEVNFAASLNKRIAPIVWRDPGAAKIPIALSKINYLFFTSDQDFNAQIEILKEELKKDIGWIREHTRLSELALAWQADKNSSNKLLRGNDIELAEKWRDIHPKDAEPPTALQLEYITASRKGAGKRRNILVGSLVAGLVIAMGLGGIAYRQNEFAKEKQKLAQIEMNKKLLVQSSELVNRANKYIEQGDYRNAALLSLEALPNKKFDIDRPYLAAAEKSLFSAAQNLGSHIVLRTHGSKIETVKYSPDGKYILVLVEPKNHPEETGYIFNSKTGIQIKALRDKTISAAFSPNSRIIATGHENGTIKLWSLIDNKLVTTFGPKDRKITYLAFHPNGKEIAAAETYDGIAIRDITTGKVRMRFGHDKFEGMPHFSFNKTGSLVAVARGTQSAYVWNTETEQQVFELKHKNEGVLQVEFNGTGDRILSHNRWKAKVKLWDQKSGKEIKEISYVDGGSVGNNYASFVTSGNAILTSSDYIEHVTRIWSAVDGLKVHELKKGNVGTFFVGTPTLIVSAAWSFGFLNTQDNTQRVIDKPENMVSVNRIIAHKDQTSFLTLTSTENKIYLWRLKPEKSFNLQSGSFTMAKYNKDASRVITKSWRRGGVKLWDTKNNKFIREIRSEAEPNDSIKEAIFSPGGNFLFVSFLRSKNIHFVDATTGEKIKVIKEHYYKQAKFIPGSSNLVLFGRRFIEIWDPKLGQRIKRINYKRFDIRIWGAAFSNDGKYLLLVGDNSTIKKYSWPEMDLIQEQEIEDLPSRRPYFNYEFKFNPNKISAYIYERQGKFLRVIDLKKLIVINKPQTNRGAVMSLEYSDDGSRALALMHTGEAILWDTRTFKKALSISGNCSVQNTVFNKQNGNIITACEDGYVRYWNSKTGNQLRALKLDRTKISFLDIHPNGRDILVASSKLKTIPLFTPLEQIQNLIMDQIPTCLSQEQRKKYNLSPEPPRWCITKKKYPYHTPEWQKWLVAKDQGKEVSMPIETSE